MKYIVFLFLYLNIYTAFISDIHAQQISLILNAEKELPPETIKEISPRLTFSSYADLKKETARILNAFQQNGFIDSRLISISEIITEEKVAKEITYSALFFIGQKFADITIYFIPENFSRKEMSRFVSNSNLNSFTIPFSEVENTLTKLNTLQTEKGDPFAKLFLSEFKKENNTLSATLVSETTNKRKIDSIIIKGYEKFPPSYIKYIAGLKKGAVFKSTTIEKASTSINALPFATSIKPPEVLFKDKQTSLYLYLEKQKSNNFDGIIGFNTDDVTNKLVFNGYLDLQLNNNLNYGETFILNYKADGDAQQNFNVKVTLPYILKSPLGVDVGLTIFKQAENFVTTSQLAGLHYQINPNAIGTFSYSGSNSSILSDAEDTAPDLMAFQNNEFSIGTQWKFYQADALFPVKTTFGVKAGVSKREIASNVDDQYRFETNITYILDLNNQNSIFVGNKNGILTSDTYVTNELYRLGGINSIRGFKENAIEATLFATLNTEYRYRFNSSIYIHSIIDLGYIENQITDNKNSIYSFGFGTGFHTNAGLLKLSFANGKIKGQDFKFSDLKIHLSLITTF